MDQAIETNVPPTLLFGVRNPVVAAGAGLLLGYAAMATLLVSLGYVLVHVLTPGPISSWDASMNRWFVTIRTPMLDSLTAVGSMIGSTITVVGISLAATIGSAIARRWRAVGLLAVGLLIEVLAFLTTTVIIDRPRPSVPKLDVAPPTSSFPSGHTAAAIVLYVGLALIVRALTRSTAARFAAWTLAAALPTCVALSRLYRGMHHATDVIGSVVLASGALLFASLAVGPLREEPR